MKDFLNQFDLDNAFKALDELEYPTVKGGIRPNRIDLHEHFTRKPKTDLLIEEYYNVSSDADLEAAQDQREEDVAQAKLDRIEKIVDLDADTEEDLQAAYVGKFVIQCPQCMTLFYKKPEDVNVSEEDSSLANVGELCPNCSNDSGFTVVGKIEDATPEPAAEEAPIESEGEATEAAPVEEAPAEGEEGGEEDLDLDLDLGDLDLGIEEAGEQEPAEESLNLSKALKDASKNTELDTENHSKNLSLNEAVKDRDAIDVENMDGFITMAIGDGDDTIYYVGHDIHEAKQALDDLYPDWTEYGLGGGDTAPGIVGIVFAADGDAATFEDLIQQSNNDVDLCADDLAVLGYTGYRDLLNDQIDNFFVIEMGEYDSVDESINNSKAQKDASKNTELDTENHSENLTLNEEIPAEIAMKTPTNQIVKVPVKDGMVEIEDKDGKKINLKVEEALHLTEGADIKKELKNYNEYIEYLQKEIEADEAALKTATNDFVKDSIQRRIDANKADLDSAMPEILKNAAVEDAAIDDLEVDTGVDIAAEADIAAEEAPADEEQLAVEETEVKEALNEARDSAECEGEDCKDCKEDVNILSGNSSSIDLGDAGATIGAALPLLADDEGEKLAECDKAITEAESAKDAALDKLYDSKEFRTPVSQSVIDNFFNEAVDEVEIKDIEELDDKSLTETVTKYLKEVYDNVNSFSLTGCQFNEGTSQLLIKGDINFTSGKTKPTTFAFNPCGNRFFEGYNFDLCDTKAFRLYGKMKDKTFFTEGIRYSYHIQDNLVEGLIRN